MRFAWIDFEKNAFPLTVLCRVLEVSRSGFRRYLAERPQRTLQRLREIEMVRQVHAEHRGVNGSRRNAAALQAKGMKVSRGKVRRLMKAADLRSKHPRPFRVTTVRDGSRKSPDLVQRHFVADRPDQTWVSDITYLKTTQGWVYLSVMIDLFSRKVVGWATSGSVDTELVLRSLEMGIRNRRPAKGLVVHSDQGCQYTSRRFRQRLKSEGLRSSMGLVGTCWDNAVAESFFASLKKESGYEGRYISAEAAIRDVASYIEIFYNSIRLHSHLGYQSPSRFEESQTSLRLAA